ncbi:MAG: hypothetical protein KDC44_06420, partial [Phaeodactylibacter sp.]|nr:hypothetical protein [Phaeodactylibacter sp.]
MVLDASASTSGPQVNYQWTGPNNFTSPLQNPTVFDPGIYTLTVTAPGLCAATTSVEVLLTPDPETSTSVSGPVDCSSTPVTLTGSTTAPNASYQWIGPGVNTNQPITTATQPGEYTFIVTDQNGCSSSEVITVLGDFTLPDISGTASGMITCAEPMAALIGSSTTPNVTYAWTGPGVNSNQPVVSTAMPGLYTLTVTGPNGCSSTEAVEVTGDLSAPDGSATVSGSLDCNNAMVTLSGSSATPSATFQWNGPGLNASQATVSASQPGVYTLLVTGPNGCFVLETVEVLADLALPDILAEVQDTIDCINSSVTLSGTSATPNATYHWSGPGVNANLPVTTTDQPGIYTFTVTGENGCTSSESIQVVADTALPDISAEAQGALDCSNTPVVLAGNSSSPGALFSWTGPGINTSLPVTTTDQPGTYTFEVTAANGCVSTLQVTVDENDAAPDLEAGVDGLITCANNTVTLTGSTTASDVSYLWEGPGLSDTTAVVSVSQAGNYIFSISTVDGCTADTMITVEQNSQVPEIAIATLDTLDCNTLSITIDATNSTAGGALHFLWQDLAQNTLGMDANLEVSSPGSYFLILTDETNGCMAIDSIEIAADYEAPLAITNEDQFITCAQPLVNLDGSNSSSDGLIDFQWFDPDNVLIGNAAGIEVAMEGTYTLVITAENGCMDSTTIAVALNTESPVSDAGPDQLLTCEQNEVSLNGSNSTGANLLFEWLDANNQTIDDQAITQVTQTGLYTLVVTNEETGCADSSTVLITADAALPTATISSDGFLSCQTLALTLDGSSSTSPNNNSGFEWLD